MIHIYIYILYVIVQPCILKKRRGSRYNHFSFGARRRRMPLILSLGTRQCKKSKRRPNPMAMKDMQLASGSEMGVGYHQWVLQLNTLWSGGLDGEYCDQQSILMRFDYIIYIYIYIVQVGPADQPLRCRHKPPLQLQRHCARHAGGSPELDFTWRGKMETMSMVSLNLFVQKNIEK